MASTTRVLDSEILASTLHIAADEVDDALYEVSSVLDAMKKANGVPSFDGGSDFVGATDMVVHSTGTRLDNAPYAVLNTSVKSTMRPPTWSIASGMMPIALSGEERRLNSGKNARISIWTQRTKNVKGAAMRAWEAKFLANILLDPALGGWNTINGIDSTLGFFERAAVGSQTNVIGGLSKATYSAVPGWQNQSANISNAFGTNGLNAMQSLKVRAKNRSATGTAGMIWILSEQGQINLKRCVQPQEFYMDAKGLDAGRPITLYAELPIESNTHMPVNTATGGSSTNTYPMTVLLLNTKDVKATWYKGDGEDGYFGIGDIDDVSGEQDVQIAKLLIRGQTKAGVLGSSGIGYAGETY
jgi:hypothetical protein